MDKFQQSFIPKRPFIPAFSKVRAGPVINILSIIGNISFILSLSFALYVFISHSFLVKNIEKMSAELVKAKSSIELNFIKEAVELDRRLIALKKLLDNHILSSKIFPLIEENTLENVRYTDFSYFISEKGISLTLSGIAKNPYALALQSDIFGNEKTMINPVFEKFDLKEDGSVSFDFKAGLNRELVAYDVEAKSGINNLNDEKIIEEELNN